MSDICLVVIARDEARCIGRCLESAAPFVDRILVLDTGSKDDTPAIARTHGAIVHSFPWTGDFSQARNKSLSLADADWNLVLDADEWIAPGMSREVLKRHMDSSKAGGLLRIRSEIDVGDRVEAAETWIPRLLPRGVQYRGRIHEQPMTMGPDQRLEFVVLHDGYRSAMSLSKHQRNLPLLAQSLAEDPTNPYLHYQMGVQSEVTQDWKSACDHYENARRYGAAGMPFAHAMDSRNLYALGQAGRMEDALNLGIQARERWPASADIHFAFGDLCLSVAAKDPARALDTWLPAAEASWLRCLEIGEATDSDSRVLGRGSYLAAHNLAVIYEHCGQKERALAYRQLAAKPGRARPVQEHI